MKDGEARGGKRVKRRSIKRLGRRERDGGENYFENLLYIKE